MIVEMIHDSNPVKSGYVSTPDASEIAEAFVSGEYILLHFNAGTVIQDSEFYLTLTGYESAHESDGDTLGPHYLIPNVNQGYNIIDQYGGMAFLMSKLEPAEINNDGKLYVGIYTD